MQALRQIKQWISKQPNRTLGLCFTKDSMTVVDLSAQNKIEAFYNFDLLHAKEKLEALVKERQWHMRDCVGVLASHYQCFLIEKPQVPEQELALALRWRLAELMDDDLDDIELDYIELPQKSNQSSNYVYVIAASREAIKNILSCVQGAGLKPTHIDIAEFAIARLYSQRQSQSLKPKVILHQQDHVVHCQIIKNNHVIFIRTLEVNLNDEAKKIEVLCHDLALHIQRSLDYCSSNIADMSNALIFIEPTPLFESLKHRLQDILGLTVESLFVSSAVDSTIADYPLLVACGGALRGHL